MFLSGHRIQFENFWKNKSGKRREKFEIIIFSLIYRLLTKGFINKRGTRDLEKAIKRLKNETEYSIDQELDISKNESELFDKYKELLDVEKNRILSNDRLLVSVISSYLMSFYDFQALIADYKKKFEHLSYFEFKTLDIDEFKERNRLVLFNNVELLIDRFRIPSTKIQHLIQIPSTHISPYTEYLNIIDKTLEIFQRHNVKLESFSEFLITTANRELKKNKQNDPYLLNALIFLLSDRDFFSLEEAFTRIETKSLQELYNKAESVITNTDLNLEIPFPHSVDTWHTILQNISASLLQNELLNEMGHQFKYRNNYSSCYYVNKTDDLVKNYAGLELSRHASMSPEHLASVLYSKAISTSEDEKTLKLESVIASARKLKYFD